MTVMRTPDRRQTPPEPPERLEGIYRVNEGFRAIAAAWESISAGSWSTAAIQSFAALARRVALDLSSVGCGALDRAVVDLVLALDALTVADSVSEAQLVGVDYALAEIRAVTVQRLLALDLAQLAHPAGEAPALLRESCARCDTASACAILRAAPRQRRVGERY